MLLRLFDGLGLARVYSSSRSFENNSSRRWYFRHRFRDQSILSLCTHCRLKRRSTSALRRSLRNETNTLASIRTPPGGSSSLNSKDLKELGEIRFFRISPRKKSNFFKPIAKLFDSLWASAGSKGTRGNSSSFRLLIRGALQSFGLLWLLIRRSFSAKEVILCLFWRWKIRNKWLKVPLFLNFLSLKAIW